MIENAAAAVAVEVSTEQAAFNAAIINVQRAADTAGEAKGDAAAAAKALREASRQAAWAAFDIVATVNDPDAARVMGGELAVTLAVARGVKEDGHKVYAMRGRDMVAYADAIRHAGRTYVADKGARKGETINGREQSDPLNIAKVQRANENDAKARREADADYTPAAMERVAAALYEGNEAALVSDMMQPGKASKAAREAVNAALADVKAERQALNDLKALAVTVLNAPRSLREAFALALSEVACDVQASLTEGEQGEG